MKKRLKIIISTYFIICAYLLITCASICFIKGNEYTKSVVAQRKTDYVIQKHRGNFLDRNMIPLTETDNVSKGTHISPESIKKLTSRYKEDSTACHLIGYVDCDGKGVCGLEKAFDNILYSDKALKLNALCSADGRIIDKAGTAVTSETSDAADVILTLDIHIQKIAEQALRKYGITGAAVVIDTQTCEVLAMASSPVFDRNRVEDYLHLTGGELINRCIMPYNAGSIFKTVTLSSALENSRLYPDYYCNGSLNIMGKSFACHKPEGHGTLDYMTAFSQSCNCAFYTIGMNTGAESIIKTAQSFGIGQPLIKELCDEESGGNLPDITKLVPLDSVNIAIGQGDILLTPLQAANTACIIANGGVSSEICIYKGIRDKNGNVKYRPKNGNKKRVLNEYCASLVAQGMRMVVTDGTASFINNPKTEIAGKTGTAESGWQKDGRNLVHGWFCGFFPASNPRYAAAVLAEDGGSGAGSAAPVFSYIAEKIMEIYP